MRVDAIQSALGARGHDPGPRDGAWGRLSIAALKRFQAATGLPQTGVPDAPTLAALSPPRRGGASVPVPPIWYAEARRRIGLHERRDRVALLAFLRSDGRSLGDPSRLPWCGDFVATCLALTLPDEPLPANPYLARNWLAFGRPVREGATGAVAVFWRGRREGASGHVGFYSGENDGAIRVLGGNQADSISECWIARDRLLGFRWPLTVVVPDGGPVRHARAAGPLSTDES